MRELHALPRRRIPGLLAYLCVPAKPAPCSFTIRIPSTLAESVTCVVCSSCISIVEHDVRDDVLSRSLSSSFCAAREWSSMTQHGGARSELRAVRPLGTPCRASAADGGEGAGLSQWGACGRLGASCPRSASRARWAAPSPSALCGMPPPGPPRAVRHGKSGWVQSSPSPRLTPPDSPNPPTRSAMDCGAGLRGAAETGAGREGMG